jgi:endonuclease I
MRKILFSLSLLLSIQIWAQVPQGYYENATGAGFVLKTQLHEIVIHIPQLYSSHWAFFESNDVLSNGKVWDIYANCDFNFGTPDNGGNQDVGTGGNVECQFFNREHTFPTSWFGNASIPRADIVHILPVDKKVNNERGNLPFGVVNNALFTSSNGSKRGNSAIAAVSGQVFEVIDEFKGDIARIFFYMATRYENEISDWENLNADGDKMLNGTSDQVFETWALEMLYQWHIQDPVSQKEIDRNNAIYQYQGNRNPFVDFPEWVCQVWNVNNCTLSSNEMVVQNSFKIYPNPTHNQSITIESNETIDWVQIYHLNGQLIRNYKPLETQIIIGELPKGFFLVKVGTQSGVETHKVIVE